MDDALHFLMQHGPLILFAVVFAEQVGLPIPALPFLVAPVYWSGLIKWRWG
jgi:membrane protein DedA with SNARE-associated domain